MTAPYTTFVARPNITAYDPSRRVADQPRKAEIDPTFLDAMKVRHDVFIIEQKVALESEFDNADARCCHWVAYAGGPQSDSTEKEPLGTIRVVPYPQAPHPTPGAAYSFVDGDFVIKGHWVTKSGGTVPQTGMPESELDYVPAEGPQAEDIERPTSFHDGKEPYVRLGRIAVVKAARGTGLGAVLVQTTLDWIQANPTFFDEHDSEAAAATKLNKFKGLVCLHAQLYAKGFYEKMGFEVDEEMGTWWDEGMPHIGMFRRVSV